MQSTTTRFHYQAQDGQGKLVLGSLEAQDRSAALQILGQQYPLVVGLEKAQPRRNPLAFLSSGLGREQQLGVFYQLNVATAAGVPLKSCLDTMAQDCEHARLRASLEKVSAALAAGSSLSEAASACPELFAHYQCMLIRAGETSGKLPEVLAQMAQELESRELLAGQVKAALTYPLFVLGFATLLIGLILALGVPQIQGLYDGMGVPLPWVTRGFLALGWQLSATLPFWLPLLLASVAVARHLMQKRHVQLALEGLLLRLPLLGNLYQSFCLAGFTRTLSMLYRGGLRLDAALGEAGAAERSPTFQDLLGRMKARVTNGEALSMAMRSSRCFPALATEMVTTGESAGCLEKMLTQVSLFYGRRCELASKSLTSLLEPALTVAIGLMLGGVILALALPFLQLPGLVAG